ncbi:MAG: tRNA (N(6)-L-threonylcarbamoyladenosine(37)-C(2))-methylthiotransferase MtaB [Candidatus Acidiferrales bacterium]
MASFAVENFGCRATQADAAAIERQLMAQGFEPSSEPARADVIVLNTCTVTASADRQAREAIRRIHRANASARIIVSGCYAQRAPEELAVLEGVTAVVGNSHQASIPGLAASFFSAVQSAPPAVEKLIPLDALASGALSLARAPAKILTGDIFAETDFCFEPATPQFERTRPVLKIQDGCNNRCSYCVIPFVRGRSRSLPPRWVIEEIRRLAAAGHREIVVSGINLGSYGRDLSPRMNLLELVRLILDESPLEFLRLSSIEPMDVTRELIECVASSGRIAPHFHVPLQSGSDRILRAMHRWYRAEHYARHIELIRELLPHAAIGADVITGFPGETDDDHRTTLEFIAALPFTYLHVFSFSARPGTAAAQSGSLVPLRVIQLRAKELRALAEQKKAEFLGSQSGSILRALTLHRRGDDWTEALSGNYIKLRVSGLWPAGEWCEVSYSPGDAPLPASFRPVL